MKKGIFKTLGAAIAVSTAAASLAGCAGDGKINSNETAIVVNGEEIPLGEANFMLRKQQAQTYYYMNMMGLSSGSLWDGKVDEDKTYAESFKETAYDSIVQMVVARQKAKDEYGITLSEEEQNAIDTTAQSFMDANPDAESQFGVTLEQVKDVLSLYTYTNDVKPFLTEDVDTDISDDEAAQCKVLYARIKKNASEDTSSEASASSSTSDTTAKTNDELKQEAEEVLDKFRNAEDLTADTANELADSVDENFFAMEYSYGAEDTGFSESVKEAAATLSDGQLYDQVIDDDSYYYIVKMISTFDREATDKKKESMITERKNTAVEDKLKEWQEAAQAEAKGCWKKLVIRDKDIYTIKQVSQTTGGTTETSSTSSTSAASSASSTSSAS